MRDTKGKRGGSGRNDRGRTGLKAQGKESGVGDEVVELLRQEPGNWRRDVEETCNSEMGKGNGWHKGENRKRIRYRVIHKKLSHKTGGKMQEKMKMILQVDENI